MIPLNEDQCRRAIEDFDTPGIVLLTITMHAFGENLLGDIENGIEPMDPVEIWAGINEKYGAWVSDEGENRLNALLLAMHGDIFYRDLEVFVAVASALVDGDIADTINGTFDEIEPLDVAWAIAEVGLARNMDEDPEFSLDVREYIESILADEPEDHESDMMALTDLYNDTMQRMQAIGVTVDLLRLLDADYADSVKEINEIQLEQ